MLKINIKAPTLNLSSTSGNSYSLKDSIGKYVVLYFYPKDDTPGCTIETNDFNKLLTKFKKLNCDVLGISKDGLKSHNKFKEKYKIWAKKKFMGWEFMGVIRSTFLIDLEVKILKIWDNVEVKNHAKEVLETLKDIQK